MTCGLMWSGMASLEKLAPLFQLLECNLCNSLICISLACWPWTLGLGCPALGSLASEHQAQRK